MKTILNILMCMSLLFSQMTPLVPLTSKLNNLATTDAEENTTNTADNTPDNTDSSMTTTTPSAIEDSSNSSSNSGSGYSAKASNFIALDLEGYCTINVPLSHFVINEDNCTPSYKQINYCDNKTRLYMSYVTNMDESADISGYITREVAEVDTVTNDNETIKYGDYDWVKIKADHQEDDCNIYVYYTLSKDKTSAFWIKAKVAMESDDEKFNDIITQTLNTYYLYAVSGTLFEVPETGYYKDHKDNDETVADTSEYEANSDKNNVFQSRGGYVIGANISDDWEDLEIILDGYKFSLPSTVKKFEKAGFKLNDLSVNVTKEDKSALDVPRGQTKTLTYRNHNGTVIKLTAYNDNASKNKQFRKCQVVAITVDAEKLVDVVETKSSEVYNDETAASDMTAANAKDKFNHELILPGGITWGVYADDLKAYYGVCMRSNYTPEIQQLTWESSNKRMIIRTNLVYGIKYVQLSCLETLE